MELSPERKDEGARASSSSSPSCEADDDKQELPKQKQQQQQQRTDVDNDDDEDDDEGTRQPYKCTFCRRGFPTAQALGGHMNVHRRHRGRQAAAAAAAVSTGPGAAGSSAGSCYDQPCSTMTTTPVLSFAQAQQASTSRPAAAAVLHAQRKPHELHLFIRGGDYCATGRGSAAAAGDVRREDGYSAKEGDGGEELDLELRLGGAGS